MKFLLVSEAKLKITLRDDEMKEYSIDPETVDRFNSASRRGFWRVLEIAKERVGFDASGDKVLIQFYPISRGECEVFVTKLGILSPSNARLVSKSSRVNTMERKVGYYLFSSFSDLACAARELFSSYGALDSTLYSVGDGRLVLSLVEYKKSGEHTEFPILTEYSSRISADAIGYLSEHSECLVDGSAIKEVAGGFIP